MPAAIAIPLIVGAVSAGATVAASRSAAGANKKATNASAAGARDQIAYLEREAEKARITADAAEKTRKQEYADAMKVRDSQYATEQQRIEADRRVAQYQIEIQNARQAADDARVARDEARQAEQTRIQNERYAVEDARTAAQTQLQNERQAKQDALDTASASRQADKDAADLKAQQDRETAMAPYRALSAGAMNTLSGLLKVPAGMTTGMPAPAATLSGLAAPAGPAASVAPTGAAPMTGQPSTLRSLAAPVTAPLSGIPEGAVAPLLAGQAPPVMMQAPPNPDGSPGIIKPVPADQVGHYLALDPRARVVSGAVT